MVLLGRKIKTSLLLLVIMVIPLFAEAEEVITVQATPKVQAVNLAPLEGGKQTVVQPAVTLPPQTTSVVTVQPAPVASNLSTSVVGEQVSKPQSVIQNKTQSVSQQVVPNKSQVSQTTPTNISFDSCTKMFATNVESLFVLTLSAVEANGFIIKEFQSRGGFIIFKVQNKEFLVTVSEIDNKNSMLKINPTNGHYHFAPGIITKMFEYIDYKLSSSVNK